MTAVPADGYLSNTARTVAQMQQAFEDISSVLMEMLGGADEYSATLASDAYVPINDYAVYKLSPESGTADNFATITNTNTRAGQVLAFRNNNSANTITVKHGTGNIYLADGLDYAMNNTSDFLFLIRRGTSWYEAWRTERNKINTLPGAIAEASSTIASGMLPITQSLTQVEGEGAASDNLDGLSTTFLGNFVILRAYNASHVITVRNNQSVSAGYYKILTADGTNLTLDSISKYVAFSRDTANTAWREVFRAGFSSSTSFTDTASSGSFSMNGASLTSYKIDTSGGAATGTLQTSPADGRIYSMIVTSSTNNATIQTTGGEVITFADGTTATSFTLRKGDGCPMLMAVTGGYREI